MRLLPRVLRSLCCTKYGSYPASGLYECLRIIGATCPICAMRTQRSRSGTKLVSMRGADLIREARTRAGLTQDELAERSGIARSLIARWEQGEVSPSIDNFLAIIEACGFEIPLVLSQRDTSLDERLDKNRHLSPERRARRLLTELEKTSEHG